MTGNLAARPVHRLLWVFGLIMLLALGLAACGSSPDDPPAQGSASSDGALPDEFKDRPITIALDPGFGELNELNPETNEFEGLNVDLINAIADELGAEVELEAVPFEQIILGVGSGRYDMSMSAVTDTVERQQQVDFVDYVMMVMNLGVQAGNPKGIGADATDTCGLKVGVVTGTVNVDLYDLMVEACDDAALPKPIQVSLPSTAASYVSLESGQIDMLVSTTASNHDEAKNMELVSINYGEPSYYGAIFAKSNNELRDAWLAGLEAIVDSGEYDKYMEEYDRSAIALHTPGINLKK